VERPAGPTRPRRSRLSTTVGSVDYHADQVFSCLHVVPSCEVDEDVGARDPRSAPPTPQHERGNATPESVDDEGTKHRAEDATPEVSGGPIAGVDLLEGGPEFRRQRCYRGGSCPHTDVTASASPGFQPTPRPHLTLTTRLRGTERQMVAESRPIKR
jgi:hypothetical protein